MSAWLKLVIALAVATVFALIGATVLVGSKVREETVVAHPYEQGLQQTCDVGAGPCTRTLSSGGEVTLEIGPRPLRTMRELTVHAVVRAPEQTAPSPQQPFEVTVSFTMPGMEMGQNRVVLAPGPGGLAGKAVLVRCPSGTREWAADVSVTRSGDVPRTARFLFTVVE